MPEDYDNDAMLEALRETAAALFEGHVETAEKWFPHQESAWRLGEDFKVIKNTDKTNVDLGSAEQSPLSQAQQEAIHADLLDLENTPNHFRSMKAMSPPDHPLRDFAKLCTAERLSHAATIRSWVEVERIIDPDELKREPPMTTVSSCDQPLPPNTVAGLVFWRRKTALTAHRHEEMSRQLTNEIGRSIMELVAREDQRHENYWGQLTVVAWSVDTPSMMAATAHRIARERRFEPDRDILSGAYNRTPEVTSL